MVKKYSYRVRAWRVSPESNYPLKTKRKASFSSLLTHTHYRSRSSSTDYRREKYRGMAPT